MHNFQTVHDRKLTKSLKWDQIKTIFHSEEDILPMWVADMDFQAPEAVNQALIDRAKHGIYGYTTIDNSIIEQVQQWLKKRHHWDVKSDSLTFSPSVITSLYISVTTFTKPGDKVLIQTPVYPPFFNIVKGTNRELIENPLQFNGEYYEIDFEDLENKFKQGVKAMIFCSPHNPVGRVWRRDELEKLASLCNQYDVLIFSDEIHADLIFKGHKHIPIATLSDETSNRTITYMSPTKTFNLAGLQVSYIITTDKVKRDKMNKTLALQGFSMLNMMGIIALEASYKYGEEWLEQLISTITENKEYVKMRLESESNEQIKVINAEGTYLLWIDFSGLKMKDIELKKFLVEKAKVGLNAGVDYGKNGEQYMRINIACPKKTLEEGINRIIHAVNNR